jgi:hypothetical protein
MAENSDKQEIQTWAEIAAFLGVSVRTAQHYEKAAGLPVYRLEGERARVWGYSGELSKWKRDSAAAGRFSPESREPISVPLPLAADSVPILTPAPFSPEFASPSNMGSYPYSISRRRWLYTGAAGLTAGGLAAFGFAYPEYRLERHQPATAARIEGATLVVTGKDGFELWRHTFPAELDEARYRGQAQPNYWRFADVDGDGSVETLFCCISGHPYPADWRLICFSADGKVRWEFIPEKIVEDNLGRRFAPPYWVNSFEAVRSPGTKAMQVIVSSNHNWSFPNQVAVLDGTSGQLLSEYWHRGHLLHLALADLEGNGRLSALLGGVNDAPERKQATLLAFDPSGSFPRHESQGGVSFAG